MHSYASLQFQSDNTNLDFQKFNVRFKVFKIGLLNELHPNVKLEIPTYTVRVAKLDLGVLNVGLLMT